MESIQLKHSDPQQHPAHWSVMGYLAALGESTATTPRAKATKPTPPPRPADSPYLTAEEAAAYCRVALKTLYNHRHEIERMPGTGKLLFRVEALDSWLESRAKKKRRRI